MSFINSAKKALVRFTKTIRLTQPQVEVFKKIGAAGVTKYFGTQGSYSIALPNGSNMRLLSSNSFSDNRLMRFGLFYNEKVSKQVWLELCAQAKVVVDVGANVGQFVLMALGANPKLWVEAFEPLPQNVAALKANLDHNVGLASQVNLHAMALSHSKGKETLYFNAHDIYTPSLKNEGASSASITVPTDTMDNVIKRPIDVVKMDIEGAEPYVLQGMRRILEMDKPFILTEVLRTQTGAEIESIVSPCGYKYFFIDEEKGLVPSATIDRRHQHSHNFLLVPASKLHQVPKGLMA